MIVGRPRLGRERLRDRLADRLLAVLSTERDLDHADEVDDPFEAIFGADGPFAAGDLPGRLDDEGRLVLVRRLIREGFLRRTGAE